MNWTFSLIQYFISFVHGPLIFKWSTANRFWFSVCSTFLKRKESEFRIQTLSMNIYVECVCKEFPHIFSLIAIHSWRAILNVLFRDDILLKNKWFFFSLFRTLDNFFPFPYEIWNNTLDATETLNCKIKYILYIRI